MEKLKSALRFGGILLKDDIEEIVSHFQVRTLEGGMHFSESAKIANEIGFIDSGIFRSYSFGENGEETTNYFYQENQFIVDLISYYGREPSNYPLQAVVKSCIFYIQKPQWESLIEKIPQLFVLSKSLSESLLLSKIKDNDFKNFGNATEKYKEFIRRYPELALQVPQHYIASYLKITPQSFSRIRRAIFEK